MAQIICYKWVSYQPKSKLLYRFYSQYINNVQRDDSIQSKSFLFLMLWFLQVIELISQLWSLATLQSLSLSILQICISSGLLNDFIFLLFDFFEWADDWDEEPGMQTNVLFLWWLLCMILWTEPKCDWLVHWLWSKSLVVVTKIVLLLFERWGPQLAQHKQQQKLNR